MNPTRHDVTMLIYNFAVVLSGGYAMSDFGLNLQGRMTMFGIAFMFSIVWTVYFKFSIVRRFVDHPRLVEAIRGEED